MHTKNEFYEYMSNKYGAKGRRSIKFSRLDELDILLGVKDTQDIDDEDKKYLSEDQLKELERIKERFIHFADMHIEE